MTLETHLAKGLKFSRQIILASNSPRRVEILKSLGIQFEQKSLNVAEETNETKPSKMVVDVAFKKGVDVAEQNKDALIISADTIVFRKKVYTKPKDTNDAFNMLKELNNKWHSVYTGVCLFFGGTVKKFSVRTLVKVNNLSDEDIKRYINDFNPLDKAGAYGIQDGVIVKKYIGSYQNIVGLPIEKLIKYLKRAD